MDYYDTHVSHPSFSQIWPPEKGQPHSLMEFQYPPDTAQPTLLDLLRQKDPRMQKIATSDTKMREVAIYLLEGQKQQDTLRRCHAVSSSRLDDAGVRKRPPDHGRDQR